MDVGASWATNLQRRIRSKKRSNKARPRVPRKRKMQRPLPSRFRNPKNKPWPDLITPAKNAAKNWRNRRKRRRRNSASWSTPPTLHPQRTPPQKATDNRLQRHPRRASRAESWTLLPGVSPVRQINAGRRQAGSTDSPRSRACGSSSASSAATPRSKKRRGRPGGASLPD
jgi:hypothetical protein